MKLAALPWIILFLPLLAAGIITLFTLKDGKRSGVLSIIAVILSFLLSAIFTAVNGLGDLGQTSVAWLSIGSFHAEFGLGLDTLSLLMMLVVSGVAGAIHVYSWGYMAGDTGFGRFFAFLSLFTFSMLGIVVSNNFLQLFIFWELVGVSSYLLISFWFAKESAAEAGKKAFITNRLGDFGFLLGILMVWSLFNSLNFSEIESAIKHDSAMLGAFGTLAGLLIFCGAVGKSAQFPLHVWLPDAMEGPTPVSALIHAATMVAAGIYMLCRVIFLLNPGALMVVAWVGGFTSLLAAIIAVQQDDIKRILAYSTLSQLGYMVMGVGLAGPGAAMFHLTTHAFFKALLFLGAGSVILAVHHEQDIWRMGGLRKKLPVTFWTFTIGTLALAGVPPLSGFYSKDAILAVALERHSYVLFGLGVLLTVLTAFYMFRLVFVAFGGAPRGESAKHAHESSGVLTWPLRILAVFSFVGGFIGVEHLYQSHFAGHAVPALSVAAQLVYPFEHSMGAALAGLAAAALGITLAWKLYGRTRKDPLPEKLGAFATAMHHGLYLDELYTATVIRFHDGLSRVADWCDRWLIAGLMVRGTHGSTELLGRALRLVQTGNLSTYAFLFALGVAFILILALR